MERSDPKFAGRMSPSTNLIREQGTVCKLVLDPIRTATPHPAWKSPDPGLGVWVACSLEV